MAENVEYLPVAPMSYERRITIFAEMLGEVLDNSYQPPRGWGATQLVEEQAAMVAALARHAPKLSEAELRQWFKDWAQRLKENHPSRSWPKVQQVADLAKGAKSVAASAGGGADDWHLSFINRGLMPPGSGWGEAAAVRLIRARKATCNQVKKFVSLDRPTREALERDGFVSSPEGGF